MKRILFLLAFAGLSSIVSAQTGEGVEFHKAPNLRKLGKLAAETEKLLFVDVFTTWCGPCQFMDEKIFTQKEVGEFLNKQFLNAKYDADKDPWIATRYDVDSYPTFLILDSTGKEIGRLVGASTNPRGFIKRVKQTANLE